MIPKSNRRAKHPDSETPYLAIANALFENYESIYDIDVKTSSYQCYHESDSYSRLKIASRGDDFFAALTAYVPRVVHPDDCRYVLAMLDRNTLLAALEREKYYAFVYRLLIGKTVTYHKIRATLSTVGGNPHILLGVRNVDETIQQEKSHAHALASAYQKQQNLLDAILASAAGYLEVNLTRDTVVNYVINTPLQGIPPAQRFPIADGGISYRDLNRWVIQNCITDNREKYAQISDSEYLLSCFEKGERRASVSFTSKRVNQQEEPCKEVFYLYKDTASQDVMSFCVIYDLTEHQRREKEIEELEQALQMSRIRNSTSQLNPHFLYNVLTSIQEVVLEDPAYASRLLGDFTSHMRSCVRAMTSDDPIPFDQELATIQAYVNIEKMRFGNRLRVQYDTPVTSFSVMPLSIQPLVENAIRHGLYENGEKGGTVTVFTRETPEAWIVGVKDDGVGFDPAATPKRTTAGKKASTGLKNLTFRLQTLMNASVAIHSAPGEGTEVCVTIPKRRVPDENHPCG